MKHLLEGVEEYGEQDAVYLQKYDGRLVVVAYNQGGYDCTMVDLAQLVKWANNNIDLIKDMRNED